MEKLEVMTNELASAVLRCKGWCHDGPENNYEVKLPSEEGLTNYSLE